MTDEDMIGYVLDLLEPAERRAVEHHLAADPEAASRVERLRMKLSPLAVDREPPMPTPGLAVRTVARLAEYIVEHEPRGNDPTYESATEWKTLSDVVPIEPSTVVSAREAKARQFPGWFRADLFVTAGIGILMAGIVVSGISRTRSEFGKTACQNNLQMLHKSLVSYSDRHDGHFPQVGDEAHATAGTFAALLAQDKGGDPSRTGFTWHCPAAPNPDPVLVEASKTGWKAEVPERVQYAYALGYRGADGKLLGLQKREADGAECDLLPIVADYPSAGSSPGPGALSPHSGGHNVLYVGGNVRFAADSHAGIGGDDIYRNQEGRVAAGLHRNDSALGRPTDRP